MSGTTESEPDVVRFNLRLPAPLAAEIDARAKQAGLSRNEWIVKASSWLCANAPLAESGDARQPAVKLAVLRGAVKEGL